MNLARALIALTVTATAMLWESGAGGASWAATPQSPQSPQIIVKDFMFQPVSLSVAPGATVTWTNRDDEPHSVKSETGLFSSGAMDTNESYSFRFEKPGTYRFTCTLHPRMTGTIVVQ